MSDPGAPRRGRHSSADDSTGGFPAPWAGSQDGAASRIARRYDLPPADPRSASPATREWSLPPGRSLVDDGTGPLVGGPLGDRVSGVAFARHSAPGDDDRAGDGTDFDGTDFDGTYLSGPVEWPADGYVPEPGRHPSAPLPPRPPGVWDRFSRRAGDDGVPVEDAPTEAHPLPVDVRTVRPAAAETSRPAPATDDATDAHPLDWQDHTGGLEVIGAHVDPRRGWRRRRAAEPAAHDDHHLEHQDDPHHGDPHHDDPHHGDHAPEEELALHGAERRGGRRRRRPLGVLVVLLLLVGVVAGVLVGGRMLLGLINPASEDFAGAGSGTAEIRVEQGDTLSDIGQHLVDAGVIASVEPFVDAAEANAAATGIQPGVYVLRSQMSGQAALDLLLDPATRQISRVTIPEGLTAAVTLQRLSEATGVPVAEFEAAAADPAALGLPDWAGGKVEGLLFPATYDFEPDATPAQMLAAMVARAQTAFDALQIPAEQRLTVLTKASLVQAEASTAEDMAKVARVLENRLSDGMALQLDTTVNYANGKGGITTTPEDRANPSLYNTYVHPGLPPGPISNPGEQALSAVQNPAEGPWRFFVVVDPDTGETRFAETAEGHQQNVLLFQQWLRENPGE